MGIEPQRLNEMRLQNLLKAIRSACALLGFVDGDCPVCQCDGCVYERKQALRLLENTLHWDELQSVESEGEDDLETIDY